LSPAEKSFRVDGACALLGCLVRSRADFGVVTLSLLEVCPSPWRGQKAFLVCPFPFGGLPFLFWRFSLLEVFLFLDFGEVKLGSFLMNFDFFC
jgi:hypothetical protein